MERDGQVTYSVIIEPFGRCYECVVLRRPR